MLGPFATASRRTPPVLHSIHQVSLLSHAATVARRLRIDVHNNDDNDNNDNAWQRGPLWPHRMGPKIGLSWEWKRGGVIDDEREEMQQRKQKWRKEKEKNERWDEIDWVKEEAGFKGKVKRIERSDQ